MAENRNDADIMADIARGDSAAFDALVDRYGNSVYAFAWRLCADVAAAEDLAQEVFLKVWLNAGKWRPDAKLTTWLYRVAYHQYVDMHRKTRPEVSDEVLTEMRDDADTPEESVSREENAQRVAAAVNALPDGQKEALVLCYYQGLTAQEAAAVTDMTQGAVESLLFRARRTLKSVLGVDDRE